MGRPPRLHCRTGKFVFVSPQQAWGVAARQTRDRAKGRALAYRCALCGWWHLTHAGSSGRARNRAMRRTSHRGR